MNGHLRQALPIAGYKMSRHALNLALAQVWVYSVFMESHMHHPRTAMNRIKKASLKFMVPHQDVGSVLAMVAEAAVTKCVRMGLVVFEINDFDAMSVSFKNKPEGVRVSLKVRDAAMGSLARAEVAARISLPREEVATLHKALTFAVIRGAASLLPSRPVFPAHAVTAMTREETAKYLNALLSHLDSLRLSIRKQDERIDEYPYVQSRYSVEMAEAEEHHLSRPQVFPDGPAF